MAQVSVPARRKPLAETPAGKAIIAQAQAAKLRVSNYIKKSKEARIPDAAMHAGAATGVAIVGGALRGAVGDDLWGIPTQAPLLLLGLVGGVAGALLQYPSIVVGSTGLITPAIDHFAAVGARAGLGAILGKEEYRGLLAA